MKKILMALTMVGLVTLSAEAQTKHSSYGQNYKVCKSDNGYAVCGKEHAGGGMSGNTTSAWQANMPTIVVVPCDNMDNTSASNLSMNNARSYSGYYQRHNIVVGDDDMHAPYEGLPSQQYDGPQRNEQRNLNYNQPSVDLPGNDGSMPK